MPDTRLFCSDLDGTLLGTSEGSQRFGIAWNGIPSMRRPLLCYNTGRLVDDALTEVARSQLPQPDFVLGGLGTQAWDVGRDRPVPGFDEPPDGWDLSTIERVLERELPTVRRQPPELLHACKSSWYLPGATREVLASLEVRLRDAGVKAVIVYSSQRDLDILPSRAGKGQALIRLAQLLGMPPRAIVVAGDSGNDSSMFQIPGIRGILVENAHADLRDASLNAQTYSAVGRFADGVLDGLKHFGVIEGTSAARRFSTS